MHPLWGPIRKVYRAQDQVKALVEEIDTFLEADRYGILVAERSQKSGKFALRARTTSGAQPPLRWSVAVGEIIHNLRSALDHLACQLALTSHPPSEALWRQTSFPIYRYGPTSKKPAAERWTENKACLRFINKRHRAILQRFQPYSRSNSDRPGPARQPIPTGKRNPLWLLHELSNADKHRLIQVTARIARGMGLIVRTAPPGFKVRSISTNLGVKLVDKAYVGAIEIDGSWDGVEPHFSLSPDVVFWDGCEAARGLPVRRTLEDILFQVHYRILVPLCAELPPLDPPWGPPE